MNCVFAEYYGDLEFAKAFFIAVIHFVTLIKALDKNT